MLRSFLLSACLFAAIVAHAEVSPQCHSVSFEVKLDVYDDSEQSLGRNLLFRVQTLKEPGWFIDIVPADATAKDYIYPVNPPLRFNGSQYLGPGYESLKSSMSYAHEMPFLLNRVDYDRVSSLIGNVLWPHQTADPDKAASDYKNAVKNAKKGWLKVTISSYKLDAKTSELAGIELRVQVTTPMSFEFAPDLKSELASCPADLK